MKTAQMRIWRRAARMWGVQTEFFNANKKLVSIPLATLEKVVLHVSRGAAKSTPQDLIAKRMEQKLKSLIHPVCVAQRHGVKSNLFLSSKLDEKSVQMKLTKEGGESLTVFPHFKKSKKVYKTTKEEFYRWNFEFNEALPIGYHRLTITTPLQTAECLVLVPPDSKRSSAKKTQGLFAPLYAVHSSESWGIGDLRDLHAMQIKTASWGIDFIGTLPLLANFYEGPYKDISPYSPCSKLFWNEIYLSVADLLESEIGLELKNQIRKLNSSEWVDYESVFLLKKKVLMPLAQDFFVQDYLPQDFLLFLKEKPLVKDYARFRAQDSEEEYHYHLFVQYHMQRQMEIVGKNLYLDYPVGVHPQSFDSDFFSDSFIKTMSVGAPPDIMFTHGQNWGFNPLDPVELRKNHYSYFIETLRHHMRNSKVLRLDHVMALHRLYVIPKDNDADCGAYLRYHGEELFAIVAIEAFKHNVRVVGENLGTVPEQVQEYLKKYDIFGMWLMVFEGGEYPQEAMKKMSSKNLVTFSTHDILPFRGYIDKYNIDAWKRDFFERSPAALQSKMMAKMAASPAELFLINIEDLWLESRPQNIPGPSGFPNWQRKLKYSFENWSENQDIIDFVKYLSEFRNKRSMHGHDSKIGRSLSV